RGFDAVVIGEYERASFGDQLTELWPVFARHGVQLWLPESSGPVDGNGPAHQRLVMLLGAQSKREVQRARFRVLAAMHAQTVEQGRYLGAAHRTDTAWSRPDRTPTPRTHGGDGGSNVSNPT